jgi:V/A-type H+-transporting ATPase subunit C
MIVPMAIPKYAAAGAQVHALSSRLLTPAMWGELQTAKGLMETLNRLRMSDYLDLLPDSGQIGSLELVESRLSGRGAANTRRVMTFLDGAARNLVGVWFRHYELENIKALFRAIDQGMDADVIRRFLVPLGDYTSLPWEALIHETSVSALIERFTQTHYINPLRAAYRMYERDRSMFPIEVALDIRYYRDVAAAMDRLGGTERAVAVRLFGTRLDMLNILWALRYRVYYHLSAEEIVNYTLWHTVHTDVDMIREIALGADPREIVERIWGRDAIDLSQLADFGSNEVRLLPRMELLLERYWRRLALREVWSSALHFGAVLGYIVVQEIEILDLISLLEAKGMGWNYERIGQHLIRGEE